MLEYANNKEESCWGGRWRLNFYSSIHIIEKRPSCDRGRESDPSNKPTQHAYMKNSDEYIWPPLEYHQDEVIDPLPPIQRLKASANSQ